MSMFRYFATGILVLIAVFEFATNSSHFDPSAFISENIGVGATGPEITPTFTPTPTGIGSSAPTYTPTPTFTLTPTNTPTATPTVTPTNTPTPIPYIDIVDNSDTRFSATGPWKSSTAGSWYVGSNFIHDNNNQKGKKTGRWTPILPEGTYNVFVQYGGITNRAANVPYVVSHTGGMTTVIINQQLNGGQWVLLGNFPFNPTTGYIEVRTDNTSGYVVADSVRFEQTF